MFDITPGGVTATRLASAPMATNASDVQGDPQARTENPRPSTGPALVTVLVLTVVALLVILSLAFGTTNTDSSMDGEKSTSTLPLDQ